MKNTKNPLKNMFPGLEKERTTHNLGKIGIQNTHSEQKKAMDDELRKELDRRYSEINTDAVVKLVKKGADPNLGLDENNTPLHVAAAFGSPEHIDALLLSGANINAQNIEGQTPLHIAIMQANLKAVTRLLEKNADMSIQTRDNDALHLTVERGFPEAAHELIKHGAIKNGLGQGKTPAIFIAARNNNPYLVNLLVKNGMDPNMPFPGSQRKEFFDTPLHYAVRRGSVESAEVLLKLGADPWLKDFNGNTALQYINSKKGAKTINDHGSMAALAKYMRRKRKSETIIGFLKRRSGLFEKSE